MARRVYFGFDYEDVKTFRANVVRNHDVVKRNVEATGFVDASIWEEAERHGELAVKRLIDSNLDNTSVTCILIGTRTWQRRWVRYEILKSFERNNTLLGVHINGIRDKNGQTFERGSDPFDYLGFYIEADGRLTYHEHDGREWKPYADLLSQRRYELKWRNKGYNLSAWVPCYDWVANEGYENFPAWVENAK